jgi:hypothetical protein
MTHLFTSRLITRLPQLILNNDLNTISEWAGKWQVNFNPQKNESILFSRKLNQSPKIPLVMQGNIIKEVNYHKHLGVTFQTNCSWDKHIVDLIRKASPMINCLRRYRYRLSRRTLETIYKSFILPIFDYCDFIWDNCNKEHVKLLENLNLDALRTICGATRGTSHNSLYLETGLGPLVHKLSVLYKIKNSSYFLLVKVISQC